MGGFLCGSIPPQLRGYDYKVFLPFTVQKLKDFFLERFGIKSPLWEPHHQKKRGSVGRT